MTRYQDPKVEVRNDVNRPYYYIRPYVPVATASGIVRKHRNIILGYCDEMTMKQAKSAKEQHMAVVNAGKSLLQSRVPFEAVVQKFVAGRLPNLSASTQTKYLGTIERRLLPAFRGKRLCDIDTQRIQVLVNQATTLGWWAKQDLRNTLSAIITYATEIGLWNDRNPCENVKVGRKSTVHVKRIPQSEQLAQFLDALPTTKICTAEEARLMVLTAVVAGLRVSEVLGLQLQDLDVKNQTVEVNRGWHRGDLDRPKTETSRRTRPIGPLADELLKLAQGRKPDDFLFAREDGNPPDDRDLQQHVFRPAAEKAGIYHPGFGMHTFRRLNITWRQQAGATRFEAMKAAGHANVATTWLYSVTDDERERQHVKQIWERTGGLTSGPVN